MSSVWLASLDGRHGRVPLEFRAAVSCGASCTLDYAEIAQVLDIPPGTVRSRIARGRALLPASSRDPPPGNPPPAPERQTLHMSEFSPGPDELASAYPRRRGVGLMKRAPGRGDPGLLASRRELPTRPQGSGAGLSRPPTAAHAMTRDPRPRSLVERRRHQRGAQDGGDFQIASIAAAIVVVLGAAGC